MRKKMRLAVIGALLLLILSLWSAFTVPAFAEAPIIQESVMNASGGVYWRSTTDWNTPIRIIRQGVYDNDVIALDCYARGGTVPPLYNNPLWYYAHIVSGYGLGSGYVNDHNVNTNSNVPNVPVPGVPPCGVMQVHNPYWGGYGAAGKPFSDAKASWKITSVTCGRGENSQSYEWVGLGGYYAPLEQIGTAAECINGKPTHVAWWEIIGASYGPGTQGIATVKTGDQINAEVHYDGNGAYHLAISSNGVTLFSQTKTGSLDPNASNTAECIVERPGRLLSHYSPFTFQGCLADGQPITAAPREYVFNIINPVVESISPLNGNSFTSTWEPSR